MYYLQYFGVIFFDSARDDDGINQRLYSFALFGSGACSLLMLPYVVREFDDWSEALSSSLSALTCCVTTVATIVSRLVVLYNVRHRYRKYRTTLESFEIYVPADAVALARIRRMSIAFACTYVATVLPANGSKLWNIFNHHPNPVLMTAFFGLYYFQNASLCCTEFHFAVQCIVVHSKFRDINDKLKKLNDECAGKTPAMQLSSSSSPSPSPKRVTVYERDFYRPKDKGYPMANTVELLRIEHWLTREAVNDLNAVFGVQMGLSLICIIVASLFAVYIELFLVFTSTAIANSVFRSEFLFVSWIIQYTYRFFLIAVVAHVTTKQAVKTKKLVAQMNNRYLDFSTKEELQMFYNQLSITSIEFNACGIFKLNNKLITSVAAVIATYIIILEQFHTNK